MATISSTTSCPSGRRGRARPSATVGVVEQRLHGLEVGRGEPFGERLSHGPLGEEEGQRQADMLGGWGATMRHAWPSPTTARPVSRAGSS